jgi:hypothetical protein
VVAVRAARSSAPWSRDSKRVAVRGREVFRPLVPCIPERGDPAPRDNARKVTVLRMAQLRSAFSVLQKRAFPARPLAKKMRIVGIIGFLFFASVVLAASSNSEIEALLGYLKGLDGAVFIRNGGEHTAVEAEVHLRMKWQKQSEKIKSAEDFIALCGSKSSMSGQRYQIRFKDGQLRYSDDVLTERLSEIRKPANQHLRATEQGQSDISGGGTKVSGER